MKLITAIIKPAKLEEVKHALTEHGVAGMTVSDVSGFGRQRGHTEVYRGTSYTVDLLAKIRIEILVDDKDVATTVDVIAKSASTASVGDGKVWVTPVESVVRVRTGETGASAI